MSFLIESFGERTQSWHLFTVLPFPTKEMADAHLRDVIIPHCREFHIPVEGFRVREMTDAEKRMNLVKDNPVAMERYLVSKTQEELLAIVRDYSDG